MSVDKRRFHICLYIYIDELKAVTRLNGQSGALLPIPHLIQKITRRRALTSVSTRFDLLIHDVRSSVEAHLEVHANVNLTGSIAALKRCKMGDIKF